MPPPEIVLIRWSTVMLKFWLSNAKLNIYYKFQYEVPIRIQICSKNLANLDEKHSVINQQNGSKYQSNGNMLPTEEEKGLPDKKLGVY